MLYPTQAIQGFRGDVDAEIAFALSQRPGQTTWVLPAEMRRALASSPGLDTRLEGLPVGMFSQVEVRRVGDPLYGYLRRMAALVSSDVAVIPVSARYRLATATEPAAIEIATAIISARTGQVLWYGIVAGDQGPADDPRSLASAADALSRRLLPNPNND
jgi:hypothetical protein